MSRTPAQASKRQRLTVWGHPSLATDATLANGVGICDEIAFLRTIQNNSDVTIVQGSTKELDWANKPMTIELSDTVVTPVGASTTPSVLRTTMLRDSIKACHKAGMQALAGYGLVDGRFNAPKRFNAWLRSLSDGQLSANRDAEIGKFTQLISDFLDVDQDDGGGGVFFDGISFDIEAIGWWPASEVTKANKDDPTRAQQIGEVVRRFYTMLADTLRGKLVASAPKSQFVAVSGGGLVDATHANNSSGGPAPALFSSIAQPYQMTDSRVNLVLRPMAYDNFEVITNGTVVDNTSNMDAWHNDIIDYALSEGPHAPTAAPNPAVPGQLTSTGADVGRDQFQLGIKISPGPSNTGKDKDHNLDGVMKDSSWIRRRCGELHNRGVGLCIFALPDANPPPSKDPSLPKPTPDPGLKSFWGSVKTYDAALNPPPTPGNPITPPVQSEPSQYFHDAVSIKVVKP